MFNKFGRFTKIIVFDHEWKCLCLPGNKFGSKKRLSDCFTKIFLKLRKSK